MAKRTKDENSNLAWQEVDTAGLSKKLATAFKAYRAAQDSANELRKKFDEVLEQSLRDGDHVPDGQYVIIAHRWGKVSFAVTDEERKTRGGGTKVSV